MQNNGFTLTRCWAWLKQLEAVQRVHEIMTKEVVYVKPVDDGSGLFGYTWGKYTPAVGFRDDLRRYGLIKAIRNLIWWWNNV